MEDKRKTSSFLLVGEQVEIENVEQGNPLVRREPFPEPSKLFIRVCTRPLSELTRTTVPELRTSEIAVGCYLLLRTLEPTVTGTMNSKFSQNALVLVEDHAKNRTTCCLHWHVHLRFEAELKEQLLVNTVFVLKEPFLVVCSEDQVAVVVGSPSDFVVVGRSHVLYEDAEALGWREKQDVEGIQLQSKWQKIGDDLFRKRKLHEAIDAYLFAMNKGDDKKTKLLLNLNLSRAYLSQGCYESAIKHASNVLQFLPLHEKALFCTGRALYELRQFKEAKSYFEALAQFATWKERGSAELARCEDRLREAEGNVDIYKLYCACFTDIPAPIDHGNFLRDAEFGQDPGNECGVYATQDIEPGTLILAEKPLVGIYESSCCTELGTIKFFWTTYRTILKNPKTYHSKLYNLPGGKIQADEKERIFCDEVNELEPIVDVRRLNEILVRNVLKAENDMVTKYPFMFQVYESASRFQHSCLPNCTLVVYNDLITVRTCSPVQNGEELFLKHYDRHISFPQKQELFELQNYTCNCDLCAQDKIELNEVHDHREELITKFDAEKVRCPNDPPATENDLLPIVKELEVTYNNRGTLRLHLFLVYRDLAKIVHRTVDGWKDKVSLYVAKGLESVGLSTDLLLSCAEQDNLRIPHCSLMPELLFDYAGLMAEKEYFSERLDLASKWVKVLLLLERIFTGGNVQMLKDKISGYDVLLGLL